MGISIKSKKFISDVGWIFLSNICVLGIGFLRKPILFTYLNPANFGIWILVLSIQTSFQTIFLICINTSVSKFIAKEYQTNAIKGKTLFTVSLLLSILFGIICLILLQLLSDLISVFFQIPILSSLIKIISIATPFIIITQTCIGGLIGLRRMKLIFLIRITGQLFSLIVIVILIILKYNIYSLIVGYSIINILNSFLAIYLIRDLLIHINLIQFIDYSKNLLKFGATLYSNTIVYSVNQSLDIYLVGYFLNTTFLGIYSLSVSIARLIWIIPSAIQQVTYPAITHHWYLKEHKIIKKIIDRSIRYSLIIVAIIIIIFISFSSQIMYYVFGKESLDTIPIILVLFFGTLIFSTMISVGMIFASIGKMMLIITIPIYSIIVNFILSLIMIPLYGITGAAIAVTLSQIFSFVIGRYYIQKVINYKISIRLCLIMVIIILLSILVISIIEIIILNNIHDTIFKIIYIFIIMMCIYQFILDIKDRKLIIEYIKSIGIRIK